MTPEQIDEYIKCYKDPIYYLNNYGYVFDLEKKIVDKLTLYPFQIPVVKDYQEHINNIVLKSRQQGLSVVTAGYVAWLLIFGTDERILIVANDYKGAARFVDSVKIFLDNAPKWMLPDERIVNNQKELKFSNGCSLKAVASSPNAGRGEALTLLVLDETAFIEHADAIWMGAGIALSVTGGKCIMISTPFGTGNLYYRTWTNAMLTKEKVTKAKESDEENYIRLVNYRKFLLSYVKKNKILPTPEITAEALKISMEETKVTLDLHEETKNNFNGIKVHWANHPVLSRGLEWRKDEFGIDRPWSPWYEGERKRLEYDNVKISQELDLSFEGSRNLVVESPIIERFKAKLNRKLLCYFDFIKVEDKFVDYETAFKVWYKPELGVKYIVAADVARGDGSDYSTIQVIDAVNLRQVAEYKAKIFPDQFASVINEISIVYNMAYVAVECNSFGLVTSMRLKNDLHYPSDKIYHSKSAVQLFNKSWKAGADKEDIIPGWQTTTKTRPLIISSLQRYMREGEIEINSIALLDEFQTFVFTEPNKNSTEAKAQHAPGHHDDLIFAFGIALIMRDTEYQNSFWTADDLNAMLSGFEVKQSNFELDKVQPIISTTSQKQKDNDDDNLSWLYGPIVG